MNLRKILRYILLLGSGFFTYALLNQYIVVSRGNIILIAMSIALTTCIVLGFSVNYQVHNHPTKKYGTIHFGTFIRFLLVMVLVTTLMFQTV